MIQVEADTGEEWDSRIGWADLAREAVGSAVRHSGRSALADSALVVEVSVKFTSDAEVRSLNSDYRNKDKATNVLSFPMVEPELLDSLVDSEEGEVLLGDIVLAHDTCAAEAAEKKIPVQNHASHLVVHGALHLLGYDHEEGDDQAEAMESVESAVLAALKIPDPYAVTEVQT